MVNYEPSGRFPYPFMYNETMKSIQAADNPEEILDIVDEQDRVIGQMSRREVYAQGLRNYRVVHAFIRNAAGKLWIPRRVATKKLYPNALDFSVAGHVSTGETYEDAIRKEAAEEVNLDLTIVPYRELGYFNPQQQPIALWQKVYEVQSDVAPQYNPEDFSSYEWLLPEEVLARHKAGEEMKSDIPAVIKLCYLS